ncbi:MAG: hypothetical protein COB61_011905 [Thiotrichales bacterium]|nr:hypothetical protein [Thiotrichales bacterium]
MDKALAFSLFGLLIGPVASVLLVQRYKKPMKKTIQYSNKPIGDLKLMPDFLPSPEELVLKQ